MDFGTAILIAAIVSSVSFLVQNLADNIVSGVWMRLSGEIEPGDELFLKTDFKEKKGVVSKLYLRNVVIELDNGKELLVEAKKILKEDIIRKRDR